MKVLFIPLEEHFDSPVHRGSNMIRVLKQEHEVIGLKRKRGFGAGSLLWRGLQLALYWLRVASYSIRNRRDIHLVFSENTHALLGGMIGRVLGKPSIWDIEGEDTLYMRAWRRPKLFAWLVLTLHRLAWKLNSVLIVPCEQDRRGYLRRGFVDRPIHVIPLHMDMNSVGNLLVDTESIGTRTGLNPKRTTLIYTGQRTERPYRDGAAWICSRLTVGLGSLLSETQIILTGKGARIPCPYPQVIFTGLVENFLEYLAAADICLLPVWREVGIAGKIVEYMAMGKPVVATHFIRGLDHLRDGYDVLIARNEQEFVDKVIYLVRNPAEARAIGLRARESARRHHSYEAIAPRVWQLLDGISQTSK